MKLKTLVVAACCALGTIGAVQAESIGDALAKCSQEKNSLQRLVCYDRLVKDMNQYSGLDESMSRRYEAPTARKREAQPLATGPETQARQDKPATEFGLEHKQDNTDGTETMFASIVKIDETLRGNYVLTLDNGTVWRQTDDGDLKLKEGQEITIDRGVFSAFYLSKEGVNKRIRVERIK